MILQSFHGLSLLIPFPSNHSIYTLGFYAVMEVVLKTQGRFADIIPCYIKDKSRAPLVFPFIHSVLQNQQIPRDECKRIRSAVMENIGVLVKISAKDLARLALVDFVDVLGSMVVTMRKEEDMLYAFLEALVLVLVSLLEAGVVFGGSKVA